MALPVKDLERRVVTVMAKLDGVAIQLRRSPIEVTDVGGISGSAIVKSRRRQFRPVSRRALEGIHRTTALPTEISAPA